MRLHSGLLALLSVLGGAPLVLTGCVGSTEQRCDGRGGPSQTDAADATWNSEAQRRAATAISCDAFEIMGRVSAQGLPDTQVKTLQDRVRKLAALASDAVGAAPVNSSRLPLSPVHGQMYEVAAEAERASGSAPVLTWAADPWAPLDPLERPADDSPGLLSTALMRGERRALAINIRNTSATPRRVRIQITLPAFPAEALQIHRVNWTGNDESSWAAAELQLLGDASKVREVTALPGVTQQIWVQVHPDIATQPGLFRGRILVSAQESRTEIPLDITIFKRELPERLSMHFGGWDYAEGPGAYAVNKQNRSAFGEYLQQRHVDTPWADGLVMDLKSLSADRNVASPLDTSRMARWLSEWPSARRFRVYLRVQDSVAPLRATDSRFAQAIAAWTQAWAQQIRRLNRSPEQFDLLLVDEPQTPEQVHTTELWAKAIHDSGAGFRIWVDIVASEPSRVPPGLVDAADTLCLNFELAEQAGDAFWNWARELRRRGKSVELYAFDGPARRLDPSDYYRLAFWKAFFVDASAVSFWSFSDTGDAASDNEFSARDVSYTPLFISSDTVRPGKHMEAAAQGIEDVEYFRMLREVAATHESPDVRRQADELLQQAASFARSARAANSQWRLQREGDRADEQRKTIGAFLDSAVDD